MFSKQRDVACVFFHLLGMGRHDHLHEALGCLVSFFPVNDDFINSLGVVVPDCTPDQAAILKYLGRRNRVEG